MVAASRQEAQQQVPLATGLAGLLLASGACSYKKKNELVRALEEFGGELIVFGDELCAWR